VTEALGPEELVEAPRRELRVFVDVGHDEPARREDELAVVVEVELQGGSARLGQTSARESLRKTASLTWRTSWLSLKTMTCFMRR